MKKVFPLPTIAILSVIIYTSCNNFLEKGPIAVLDEATYIASPETADAVLISAYDKLSKEATWDYNMFVYGDAPANNLINTESNLADFNPSPTNPRLNNTWNAMYDGITSANLVIAKVPSLPANQISGQQVDQLVGQAKFLRALYYFNLANVFGNVPLVLKPIESSDSLKLITQSTREVVFKQLEEDLKDASARLPVSWGAPDLGRATKGSADGLLSKLYLYQEKWQEAADRAEAVINSPAGYKLNENFNTIFTLPGKNTPESVFEIQNKTQGGVWSQDDNEGSDRGVRLSPGCNGFNGWGAGNISQDLYKSFDPSDPRRKYTILSDGDVVYGKKYDSAQCNPQSGHHLRKFVFDPSVEQQNWDLDDNFSLIRLADILLIHSEALNELGKTGEAEVSINKVLERARKSSTPASTMPANVAPGISQNDLRSRIRLERRRELAGEGQYFFDLVRWGIADQVLSNFKKGVNEIWPIPQPQLDLSPALKQNKGY